MSITLDEIKTRDNGARFFDADLHVHSFGGSHDVKDQAMTIDAIIDAAVKHGVSLLAITDHNTDKNTERSIEYSQKYAGQLLVLAGTEITTAHGHLLVYFDPHQQGKLRNFIGQLNIVNPGSPTSHTAMSMADVIATAERQGGLCIAAHIDMDKTGFEALMASRYPSWKRDILLSLGLRAVEVADETHLVWYSDDDEQTSDGTHRRQLLTARAAHAATSPLRMLAHVQNSDAHSLAGFVQARTNRQSTRYKMNDLSFEGFRTALTDPEARVRAVAPLPRSVPRVLGMAVNGGFLDGEIYHFSDNLNCFIGGRGAGKSSSVQSLAYALGSRDHIEEQDNCPDSVVVYCEDANGVKYRFERTRRGDIRVLANDGHARKEVAPDAFTLEFYGQGDLADVARDPLANTALLQQFLDQHLVLHDLIEQEQSLVAELNHNSSSLIPLEERAAKLGEKKQKQDDFNRKIKIAEEGKLQDLARIKAALGAERALREQLDQIRQSYESGFTFKAHLKSFDALVKAAGELTGDARTQPALDEAHTAIDEANAVFQSTEKQLNVALRAAAAKLVHALKTWATVQGQQEHEVSVKEADLTKKGLPAATVAAHNALIKQRGELTREITKIETERHQLEELRQKRAQLLNQLDGVRTTIIERRKGQLRVVNKNLADTIKDYVVALHYDAAGVIDDFKTFIMGVMQGTYFSEEQVSKLCLKLTPAELADLVRQGRDDEIATQTALDKRWGVALRERLAPLARLHALETIWKEPRPNIIVRSKTTRGRQIPVNQLSDGQKHTILLTIAMLAESNLPLVIDQPEDDLDNEFIFQSVVRTLRAVKERRQVILVTHNANIAVLGDAELIFPMRRNGDNGVVSDRGSIDREETRKATQAILEGGELAFLRRKTIYGY